MDADQSISESSNSGVHVHHHYHYYYCKHQKNWSQSDYDANAEKTTAESRPRAFLSSIRKGLRRDGKYVHPPPHGNHPTVPPPQYTRQDGATCDDKASTRHLNPGTKAEKLAESFCNSASVCSSRWEHKSRGRTRREVLVAHDSNNSTHPLTKMFEPPYINLRDFDEDYAGEENCYSSPI